MSNSPKTPSHKPGPTRNLARRLEEIRNLEKRLIGLKHEFIEVSAIPTEDDEDEQESTFLLLLNEQRLFAVPISHVEEVIQTAALSDLPVPVQGVAGLLDYHGEMMAVVDLGTLFGLPEKTPTPDTILLICNSEILRFAVMVDEVNDVISVDGDDIHVTDEVMPGSLQALGVLSTGEEKAVVLDVLSIILSIQLDKLRDSINPPPLNETAGQPE